MARRARQLLELGGHSSALSLEQIEVKKVAEEIVAKLRLAGDNGAVLLMMATELSKRPVDQGGADTEPVALS